MEAIQVERRAARRSAAVDPADTKITSVVRQGILLQTCMGTIGAVEYLKAHAIDSRVISRVLSGGGVREEDKLRLDSLYLTG
jgi:hypothetical protein